LGQVARAVQVPAYSYLRHLVEQEMQQLKSAGERRALALLTAQYAELENLSGPALANRLRVMRINDWPYLRGHFPQLAHDANRQGLRYLQLATTTETDAPTAAAVGAS
jgi:hypothetical protein